MKHRPLTKLEIDMLTEDQMRDQLIDNKRKHLPELTDENPSSQFMRFVRYIVIFTKKWVRTFAELVLNEGFLATATKWNTINTFAKMNGYNPRQLHAARATMTATYLQNVSTGIAIDSQALRFKTNPEKGESIRYEYEGDTFYIPPGITGETFTFDVIQGRKIRHEDFGESDGSALQSFITLSPNVVDGSELVEFEEYDGDILKWVAYQPTDNLLMNLPTDRVYERSYSEDGRLIITLGNAIDENTGHGYIPGAGRKARISYRVLSGNENGNVAPNTITHVHPASRIISVTNPGSARGWTDREDTESVRWNAMRHARVQKTIGKFEDYVGLGENISGGRCYALANIFGNNSMTVYFVNSDGGLPNAYELMEYERMLDTVNHAGEFVVASAALFEEYDATILIRVADNYNVSDVIDAVDSALDVFFNPLSRDSNGNRTIYNGDTISPSKISHIAMDVPGVMGVSVTSPTSDVSFAPTTLPKKGTIVIGVV